MMWLRTEVMPRWLVLQRRRSKANPALDAARGG